MTSFNSPLQFTFGTAPPTEPLLPPERRRTPQNVWVLLDEFPRRQVQVFNTPDDVFTYIQQVYTCGADDIKLKDMHHNTGMPASWTLVVDGVQIACLFKREVTK